MRDPRIGGVGLTTKPGSVRLQPFAAQPCCPTCPQLPLTATTPFTLPPTPNTTRYLHTSPELQPLQPHQPNASLNTALESTFNHLPCLCVSLATATHAARPAIVVK